MWLLVAALLACAGAALIPEPEVQIQVLEKPFLCKRKTKNGDMLLVHSEGFLQGNGTRFYSTYVENNGQPVWFTLGIREVIKGWDTGLQDMCVGEKRQITVPPALAYGKEGKVLDPKCGLVLHEYSPLENIFVLTELMHVDPPPFCQCLYYNRKNSPRQYINLQH